MTGLFYFGPYIFGIPYSFYTDDEFFIMRTAGTT